MAGKLTLTSSYPFASVHVFYSYTHLLFWGLLSQQHLLSSCCPSIIWVEARPGVSVH